MKRSWIFFLLTLFLLLASAYPVQAASDPVIVLEIEGVINPFSARYLDRGLSLAEQQGAQLVIITLNTPGGLETSMREMIQSMQKSPLPIVVYVTPDGARATSAGLFILMAADFAAMAPATNVGAASPVPFGAEISDVMEEKITSDAAALIRSLAEKYGRNAEWAEDAVRKSLSLTASEALNKNVIEFIAEDLPALLSQLDGQVVKDRQLITTGIEVQVERMTWIERFYHVITEPNIAYLLLSLGTIFLLAELADPGLSIAGIGTVLSFLIGFMALGSLPVNWVAIALIVLSVIMFVVALLTDTEVVVTVLGLVPFVLGSLLLFRPFSITSPAVPDLRVSTWLIVVMALGIVGFSLIILRAIIIASKRPPRMGAERFIGHQGQALTDLIPNGQVQIDHQEWSAISKQGEIKSGELVNVVGVSGVRLIVTPLDQDQ